MHWALYIMKITGRKDEDLVGNLHDASAGQIGHPAVTRRSSRR